MQYFPGPKPSMLCLIITEAPSSAWQVDSEVPDAQVCCAAPARPGPATDPKHERPSEPETCQWVRNSRVLRSDYPALPPSDAARPVLPGAPLRGPPDWPGAGPPRPRLGPGEFRLSCLSSSCSLAG